MITHIIHDPSDPIARGNIKTRIKVGMLQIRRWTSQPISFGVAGDRLFFFAESELPLVAEIELTNQELISAYIEQKQPSWGDTVTDALSDNNPLGVYAILVAHLTGL